MNEMTDEKLAGKLEEHAKHGSHAFPPLLSAAAERIRALSAHVALLKASLAQAEREAEKPAASAEPVGVRPYEPTEAMRWAAKVIDPALSHEQIRALWASMWSAYAPGEVGIPTSEPMAWAHPDGRVVPASTMDSARHEGGAMLSSLRGYTIPLGQISRAAAIAEPVAWANFAETGNIRIWTSAAKDAVRIAKENGIRLTPLYTAPQPDRVAELTAEVKRLRAALFRLMTSDPAGAISNASDDELRFAVNDERADPVVREHAASILQGRAALARKEAAKC